MLATFLCVLASVVCVVAGRRSLVAGLGAVLAVGYLYGIVRANVLQPASHFVFDAGAVGLYMTQLGRRDPEADGIDRRVLVCWVIVLAAWPLLLLAVPKQDPLIQIVGLRGNVFLLPFLLLGARLTDERAYRLALWCACLNIAAFALGVVEFQVGIERFFPRSGVTFIMYNSNDVARNSHTGHGSYRIPSSFTSAHAYGGAMLATLPLLVGALMQTGRRSRARTFLLVAVGASTLGVFMSAARTHAAVLLVLASVVTLSGRVRLPVRIGWVALMAGVGVLVSQDARLQRITSLLDTGYVEQRVGNSVNLGVWDLVSRYPMGNGLGGGGTSIPYFLLKRLENPLWVENEYARILLELGIPGLMLWAAFIVWVLTRRDPAGATRSRWGMGRRMAWWIAACTFGAGLIGTGMLTAIPQTCLLLLLTGWLVARRVPRPIPTYAPATVASAPGWRPQEDPIPLPAPTPSRELAPVG